MNFDLPLYWTPEVAELFIEFLDMRKAIRKPIRTERATKARIRRLEEICGQDVDKTIKVIIQSLENEWQDFYDLRDKQTASRWDKL